MTTTKACLELLPQHRNVKVVQRARDYLVDGVSYQRVSTILGVIDKPVLAGWAKRVTLEAVEAALMGPETQAGLETLMVEAQPGEYEGWVSRLMDSVRHAADAQRDKAADRGTEVHREIAAALADDGPPFEIYISDEADRALQCLADRGWTVDATEATVWSDALMTAGTCDAVGRDKDGRRIIWDWKTGSGPWWEMALQLGAYAGMLHRLTGEPVEDAYIVKLMPDRYEVHRVNNLVEAQDAFLWAVQLSRAGKRE